MQEIPAHKLSADYSGELGASKSAASRQLNKPAH